MKTLKDQQPKGKLFVHGKKIHYCQLVDKNCQAISREICNFHGVSKFYLSVPQFLAEPWLENAALNFHPSAIVKYTGNFF